MATEFKFKCHFCAVCDGTGCIGQIPGMGGVRRNENFRLNFDGWEVCRKQEEQLLKEFLSRPENERVPKIRIAPITGAVENIGYRDEETYYHDMIFSAEKAGIGLCIGDGTPDIKLKAGINAIKELQISKPGKKAAVFIKPYSNKKISERISWAKNQAEIIGIDIDSYNIVTMRNLVNLERKTAGELIELKKSLTVPFALKGVFLRDDIDLIKEVHPDIVYVSNHGGRVETRTGSTAEFLLQHRKELLSNCGELWIDGGIRTRLDVATAMSLGADQILIGRPFVSALCKGGEELLRKKATELKTPYKENQ